MNDTESPLKSKVFFGSRELIASATSDRDTGLLEKLKRGVGSGKLGLTSTSSGGWSEGMISLTIDEATLVKNSLNLLATLRGLVTTSPSMRREYDCSFFLVLY